MIGFGRRGGAEGTPSWSRRRDAPVYGRHGMVASAHPLVTAAGLNVLQGGGNAVDAAVCAALTAAVVMPEMCGLGGDLFAIVHSPVSAGDSETGETLSFMGSGIAPRRATTELMRAHGTNGEMPQHGPLSVSVPGMVDAYFTMLDRFGSRSFAELVAPAIEHATGHPLTPFSRSWIVAHAELLERYPSSAAVFLPGGKVPDAGVIVCQPDLARTLKLVADGGRDAFYRGEIAQRIGQFMAANGGALSAADMHDHVTEVTAPIATTYRGYTIYQTGLPTQGMILLETLNIAEHADMARLGLDSAEGIHLLVEAQKLAFADRLAYAGDPVFVDVPLPTLISKNWAARQYQRINPDCAAADVTAGNLREGETTSLCVVDGAGMMVSLIQSVSSAFGSGVVAGDTGIVLNNRAGNCFTLDEQSPNCFAPGKKPIHTLNCYLIADADTRPVLVGGTPGGDAQPQWNLQVIAGLIDAGLDVQAAVEFPRWRVWPGTYPIDLKSVMELQVEDRLGGDVVKELEDRGHHVRLVGPWNGGAVQLIARDPESGVLAGGSDPRVEGLALGY